VSLELLPWLADAPGGAALAGVLLGGGSGLLALRVQAATERAGLAGGGPLPSWTAWGPGFVAGACSGCAAALPLAPAWRIAALGVVWGHCLADVVNNVRAGASLAALSAEPDGLAAWQALPHGLRRGLVRAALAGPLVLCVVGALLAPQPATLGLGLGAGLRLVALRRATRHQPQSGEGRGALYSGRAVTATTTTTSGVGPSGRR